MRTIVRIFYDGNLSSEFCGTTRMKPLRHDLALLGTRRPIFYQILKLTSAEDGQEIATGWAKFDAATRKYLGYEKGTKRLSLDEDGTLRLYSCNDSQECSRSITGVTTAHHVRTAALPSY